MPLGSHGHAEVKAWLGGAKQIAVPITDMLVLGPERFEELRTNLDVYRWCVYYLHGIFICSQTSSMTQPQAQHKAAH